MKEWETTRIYIYEYMYNREQMYYNDLIQLERNNAFCKADALDHLEGIMALTRLATASNIFEDIGRILRRWKPKEEYPKE